MEYLPTHCSVCGVYYIDGTYRFSHKPTMAISPDDVAGLVCSNLKKTIEREHLISKCINKNGDADKGDNWKKRLNSVDK